MRFVPISLRANGARTAAVFFTHCFDALLEKRYLHLKTSCPREIPVFILAEMGTPIPGRYLPETHFFEYRLLSAIPKKTLGDGHLPMLDFQKVHPEFGFYWFIEYDVVFSGPWKALLGTHLLNDADLLTCHIRSFEEEPDWHWWNSLETPGNRIPPREKLRAFMPVCRLSAAALDELTNAMRQGWCGHCETLVPCILRNASLKIEDLGGDGSFVPEGGKNRFYTSFSCREGKLAALGTMRYVPNHAKVITKSNFLYHPVKPERFAMEDLRCMLRETGRLLTLYPRKSMVHGLDSLAISLKSLIFRLLRFSKS